MKFRTWSLALLFAVLCLAGSNAHAAAETWTSVRTSNFFLIGDADPAAIRDAAIRLEQFREAFRLIAPELKLSGKARLNVVVFRDELSYRPFKPLRRDLNPDDAVTGYFQFGEDVSYITVTGGASGGTIFHEYVHYLLRTNGYSPLPPWLNEGLAEYYETFRTAGAGDVTVGSAHTVHLGLLKRSTLIPRDEFFAADSEALRERDNETRNLYYAQAWATAHYLISRPGGSDAVAALLGDSAAREKLLLETFPTDAAFASAIRTHTAQTTLPSRTILLPAQTAISGSTIVPLSEPETNAYLGELLFRLGDLAAAESRLRRSIAVDSRQILARYALGKLLIEQKKYPEAVLHLEKAAAAAPGDGFTQFYYAYSLSLANMDADRMVAQFPPETAAKMIAALRRAIAANPDFGESYRLLAFVHFVNDGDLDEAADHIRKAVALKPENSDYLLLLARILLRQEKFDEAKTAAVRILVGQPDPKTHADAVQIVQNADDFFEAEKTEEGLRRLFIGQLPPLMLKRSTLSEADIEKIDRDRVITNFNRILGQPKTGETQVVGNIDSIQCIDDRIVYKIRADGKTFTLTGTDFTGLNMTVLIEGERTFKLDCGVSFPKQLSVLTYIPEAAAGHKGKLVSITFVPEFFRLKTPAEMAAARIVVIHDDRLFKKKLSSEAVEKKF